MLVRAWARFFVVLGLLLGASPLLAGPLKAGAATSNITPPLGGNIVGGFRPTPSQHIHDELHARCLVLDDGKTRLAIVICDLLGMHRTVSDQARKLIQERLNIPREQVLISATHTHSAVSALGDNRYEEAAPLDDYQSFVALRIADGVQRAANLLRPAEWAFTTVEIPEHVFNRRWYLRPGTMPANPFGGQDLVKMNPPGGSPNLLEPAGPTDPVVSILSVRQPDGTPIAVYAAYSLHYVGGVPGTDISADYYGVFCNELTQQLNVDHQQPPFVAMLANGTSGDINNINFREPRGKRAAYEQMGYVAKDVAAKVAGVLREAQYAPEISLGARYEELPIQARKPTAEQIQWAKETLEKSSSNEERVNLSAIYADRALKMNEGPDTLPLPLQVLKVGPVLLGTMPNEVFCEIGMDFRDRLSPEPAFLVSLAHGYYGYLPTPRHHDLGGYETWLGTNRVERTASDKMLKALLDMAAELKE